MCGIIGYTGRNNAIELILDGLKKLEYRGYDSAGIAFIDDSAALNIVRCKGKIGELVNKIGGFQGKSNTGIGHTRWATHGSPSENNAHPHMVDGIALVHNGIIENFMELKTDLLKKGVHFSSDTDTEVICHLIAIYYTQGYPFVEAVSTAIKQIRGSYAICVLNKQEPDKIICAKKDSPLVIGLGDGEFFAASDVPAFLSYTRDVIFMDDSELAILTREGVIFNNSDSEAIYKKPTTITWSPSMAEKGGYRHFMLKEIYEQPRAITDTITGRVNVQRGETNLYEFGFDRDFISGISKVCITACGTSWHAALCGKYMIEQLCRIPVEVDIASEFRYRQPIIDATTLFISITQSGETADTLAAMKEAKRAGAKTLTICNVVGSTAARDADFVFYTHSGPEIGVASTKAFVTQLVSLYLLAVGLSSRNPSAVDTAELINDLLSLPSMLEEVLMSDSEIEHMARTISKSGGFLFLGRGILYPIALEGALKLKEISYIHAEGYPAGEMKHGPIALIDENLPVVILVSKGALYEKIISNIQEVKSRGGKTVVISNSDEPAVRQLADLFLLVPSSNVFLNPVIMSIPMQLLAYHVAVIKGCDVDQPRNLAKSVTVE
ncbi:glutamine--fructose-6-phosphate transaminase (isomerizing) [Candidatus Magnetobacterium casense]|uniref:Glutamine--fructose-6-phosphate aminotransferase [isomerizing] n=1 Tax=Candidatus Magnetobacterium casense TaxID=1455061 RepID=A0ABS6RX92_9BACT|nr:glutamine--fructose-6-phosphate transaminase (isomerizing) [Candidatus Magnetobacterium casensis]MBV6341247.1 glutamine--fructose-6-phosphate transaminase (isomerizing) [Candidatus Magnetobacterium casensis]